MADYRFSILPFRYREAPAFAEASADELRVLLALIGENGSSDTATLAEATGISAARVASSVVFWTESGILRPNDDNDRTATNIVDDFEARLRAEDVREESNLTVAKTIRDHALQDLFVACAELIGRPALNDREIHDIVALYEQYGLSEEYIITLLHDLTSRSRTTIRALVNHAIKLHGFEIDTVEKLNTYFRDRDATGEWERLIRRVLGIYGRALTKSEKAAARRWCEDYEYDEPILTLAYDVTVKNTGRASVAYMEKLLEDWHRNGCRTAEACLARYGAAKPTKPDPSAQRTTKKEKPRYGTFDPEDVFKKALARSYGEEDNT